MKSRNDEPVRLCGREEHTEEFEANEFPHFARLRGTARQGGPPAYWEGKLALARVDAVGLLGADERSRLGTRKDDWAHARFTSGVD